MHVRYLCQNTSVKEEIVLSQSARSVLPDPAKFNLSRENTYFVVAMEFLLTPNDINVFARRQGAKTPIKRGNDFVFVGDDPIEFEDDIEALHFFFPKDYAHAVADSVTDFANRTSLRRYFYSQGGKNYMLVGVPLSWISSAPAGDLVIDPTTTVIGNDDVYLQDATNSGSNSSLIIGKSTGTDKKRTIIKFNVSSVPSGATVINAQMKLRYYGTTGSPWVDRSVQAHQLLVNWNETQATRDVRLTATSWALQYGAINGTDAKAAMESATLFKVNEFPVWKNWDLTTLTQKWITGAATNCGVILWATNEDTTTGLNLWFRSSDYSDSSFHPRLEIIWSETLRAVYFLKDHLGSIRATILDSTDAPILGYDDYDAWGYPLAQRTKAIPTPYLQGGSKIKFTGKERDDEFGLNLDYFGARYYDWLTGRWISVDPLANKYPQWSPYVYTLDNPIKFVDSKGMDVRLAEKSPYKLVGVGFTYVGGEQKIEGYTILGPGQSTDDVRIIPGDIDFFAFIDDEGKVIETSSGQTWFKVSAIDLVDVDFTADQKLVIRNEKSKTLEKLPLIEIREAHDDEKTAANQAKGTHEKSGDDRVKIRQTLDRLAKEIASAKQRMKSIDRAIKELHERRERERYEAEMHK